MRYIDVHCHLTGGEYGDPDGLMQSLAQAGVQKVITAGFDIPSSQAGAALAERYAGVYFTAGFHPTELKKYREGDLDIIAKLLSHPKCVALGETGLDYHYDDTDKPLQRELFVRQLQLAHSAGLPVQIHSRDCAEDMLETLKQNAHLLRHGALLHCYSHSAELAAEFLKLGVKFSFGGTATYKGSKRARRTVAALPAGSIMTETDSPYLAPASKHGVFPNTPASIPEISACLAGLRGVEEEQFCEEVWGTAHSLFFRLNN